MRKVCWALAVAVLGQGLVCAPAIADDDNFIPINACNTDIEAPGRYKLTNDLLGCFEPSLLWFRNGITVYANDVIIDLDGHTISCAEVLPEDGTYTVGVFVTSGDPPRGNVRVRNGIIENCGDGVLAAINSDSTFEKLTIRDGILGINMISGYENRIRKNHIYGMQQYGIYVNDNFGPAGKHRVTKNLVHDAGVVGISVYGIPGSRIQCNRAARNGNTGIAVGFPASDMDVRNNVANYNGRVGVSMYGANWGDLQLWPAPSGNTIRGNTALGNSDYDLAEAWVDYADETLPYLLNEGAECSNKWKGNRYITELAPLDCIAPSRRIDDDDDDGCAPGFDDDDDEDDDEDDD